MLPVLHWPQRSHSLFCSCALSRFLRWVCNRLPFQLQAVCLSTSLPTQFPGGDRCQMLVWEETGAHVHRLCSSPHGHTCNFLSHLGAGTGCWESPDSCCGPHCHTRDSGCKGWVLLSGWGTASSAFRENSALFQLKKMFLKDSVGGCMQRHTLQLCRTSVWKLKDQVRGKADESGLFKLESVFNRVFVLLSMMPKPPPFFH